MMDVWPVLEKGLTPHGGALSLLIDPLQKQTLFSERSFIQCSFPTNIGTPGVNNTVCMCQ